MREKSGWGGRMLSQISAPQQFSHFRHLKRRRSMVLCSSMLVQLVKIDFEPPRNVNRESG
jgi:hypothetical protein